MAFQLKNIPQKKKDNSSFNIDRLLKTEIAFGNSFTNKNKEGFYIELGVLLEAGLTLKDALSLLSEEQKKRKEQTTNKYHC